MEFDLTVPHTRSDFDYVGFFRPYTQVIMDWLENLQIPGKTVHYHYGSSERIWTKIIRERHNYEIDLPVCSVNLASWEVDIKHPILPPEVQYQVGGNIINAKPAFFLLQYDITWWVKYLRETDVLKNMIHSLFTPEMYLKVENKIWKQINGMPYYIDCRIKSMKDSNELEPGDKQDRIIKLDLSIEVDAKLHYLRKGYVAKNIYLTKLGFGLDSNLEEKKQEIKDNIKDESYLENLLEYMKEKTVF
jgi:hypothetical protein